MEEPVHGQLSYPTQRPHTQWISHQKFATSCAQAAHYARNLRGTYQLMIIWILSNFIHCNLFGRCWWHMHGWRFVIFSEHFLPLATGVSLNPGTPHLCPFDWPFVEWLFVLLSPDQKEIRNREGSNVNLVCTWIPLHIIYCCAWPFVELFLCVGSV